MSRYTAASDRDYYDEVEGVSPMPVEVRCVICDRPLSVPGDERGPYRCELHQKIDPAYAYCHLKIHAGQVKP